MTAGGRVLESVLIPTYYRLKGRQYPRYRDILERSQWWSPDRIREFQWQELQRVLAHAFKTVPYYKQKYAASGIELGDIRTPEDFAKLPPLSRAEVNVHRKALCSASPHSKLIAHATGGSSGIPTRFFITVDSYDWRCAASDRAYSWSGHQLGEKTIYFWGAPIVKVTPFQAAKTKAYRFLRREFVVPTFSQTKELWRKSFRAMQRFRPKFVVGYVSSLEEFAQFLVSNSLRPDGIQGIITAAEPVFDKTRRLVTQAFGAPLFNAYGSREFMSIAAECGLHDGLHINSENLVIETEFPSSETPSEFLVTDLHNYGMPFIRYRIGDIGVISKKPCPCGRGLPLITSLEGRVLEVLRSLDGRVVPGEFFPHLMKDIPEVSEFQVHQAQLDEVAVWLVLSGTLSEKSRRLIQDATARAFGGDIRVVVKHVEAIPRQASGKRSVTIGLGSHAAADLTAGQGQ